MQFTWYDALGKRIAAITMVVAIAFGACFALGGCSSASNEDVIRDGVVKTLDSFQNPTEENLAPYLGEFSNEQLQTISAYDLDVYEYLKHALRKYDYELGDITVDGDKATVKVTITNLDVAHIAHSVIAKSKTDETMAAEIQKIAESGNQAEIMQYIFKLIYEELDATDETITSDMTLTCVKSDNQWSFDKESRTALLSTILGGSAS